MDEARFLAGPKEIAKVLGAAPNTVNAWKKRPSQPPFPDPVVQLAGGFVWDIREVIAWADATNRAVHERNYVAPGWQPVVD